MCIRDRCTIIYHDYGVLSPDNRKRLMKNVHRHLRPGGLFLFDVFSMKGYSDFRERQEWENCPDGGFWRAEEYVALNGFYKYPGCVTLDQVTVISHDMVTSYYLWNTYFTKENILREAAEGGFKLRGVFGDVAGAPYSEGRSTTLAVLLERN